MSTPFILRPIATTLMIVAILLLGILGYRLLPVAALPNVDFPTIQVTTSFPGASPEVIETSITAPLEHYFGQISGLTSMGSISSYGTSQVTLQFNLSRPIDAAAQDRCRRRSTGRRDGSRSASCRDRRPIGRSTRPTRR